MIVCVYPGVGTSTLCKQYKKYIDLSFNSNEDKDPSWVQGYVDTILKLSQEGYVVFITTNELVRKYLSSNDENYILIFPALCLEKQWVDRLKKRYFKSPTTENYEVVSTLYGKYQQDISELLTETHKMIMLDNMDYDLKSIIENLLLNEDE